MLMNTMGNGRPALRRVGGLIRSLWRDRRGAVTIYIAASMPVLMGIGAMSLDLGRLMTVNTELQSAADAAAMAGAAELDQKTGARNNARAADVIEASYPSEADDDVCGSAGSETAVTRSVNHSRRNRGTPARITGGLREAESVVHAPLGCVRCPLSGA